jgi:hypothetical protein
MDRPAFVFAFHHMTPHPPPGALIGLEVAYKIKGVAHDGMTCSSRAANVVVKTIGVLWAREFRK